jgi:hypothetical protein
MYKVEGTFACARLLDFEIPAAKRGCIRQARPRRYPFTGKRERSLSPPEIKFGSWPRKGRPRGCGLKLARGRRTCPEVFETARDASKAA